jgi:hypothetical protein
VSALCSLTKRADTGVRPYGIRMPTTVSRVWRIRHSWNGWWNARLEKPGRRTDEYIGALPRRGGLFCEWGGMTSLKCRWDRGRGACSQAGQCDVLAKTRITSHFVAFVALELVHVLQLQC